MNNLALEPLCNSQEHIFRRRIGHDNCETCYRKYTDYKCKNCYRELCDRCYIYRNHLNAKVRRSPPKETNPRDIKDVCPNKVIIGRRIEGKAPPSGLRSVFGFFK